VLDIVSICLSCFILTFSRTLRYLSVQVGVKNKTEWNCTLIVVLMNFRFLGLFVL
jgi:hypothetical protein